MKQLLLFGALAIGVFLTGGRLLSQEQTEVFGTLLEEERESIEALVLYPEETRNAILELSMYPELLVRISAIQQSSRDKFIDALSPLSSKDQKLIWDLTRFPGLIKAMVSAHHEDRDIHKCLENYPLEAHSDARVAFRKHLTVLEDIVQIETDSKKGFEEVVSYYPENTRFAFYHLLELPEVLSILSDNLRLVVLAGDIYKRNPEWILRMADSLNLEIARQQAQDLADWKSELENDPEAQSEMVAAAEEYAGEYIYDDVYYDPVDDDIYYDDEEVVIVEKHYYHHFPYWFGYPTWFEYPRWRYHPYWWDWGFYFSPRRTCIVVGLPSFHFTRWYFHHPHHHHYYPHYTNRFVHHYYGHRTSTTSITVGVRHWKEANGAVIADSWLQDDRNRVRRIRDFGRFESDRIRYNQRNIKAPLSQVEFHKKNPAKYRTIQVDRTQITKQVTPRYRRTTSRQIPTEVISPRIRRSSQQVDEGKRRTVSRDRDYDRITEAKERHKQTWQRDRKIETRKVVPRKQQLPKKPTLTRTPVQKPAAKKSATKGSPRKKNN